MVPSEWISTCNSSFLKLPGESRLPGCSRNIGSHKQSLAQCSKLMINTSPYLRLEYASLLEIRRPSNYVEQENEFYKPMVSPDRASQ